MSRRLRGGVIRAMLVALLFGACPLGQSAAAEPASEAPDNELMLEIRARKNRAYVHEAVPLTVTLLAGEVSIRNVQYPRLVGETFRTSDYAPPRQTRTTRDDREYAAYEFSTTLTANRSGDIELGPAELQCDLLTPGSGAAAFFGDSEPRPVTVRSQPVRFTILPLPAKGKPAGFSGAVGHFTLAREVSPTLIQSGDPVTLTTRIEGAGNIDSFSCPALSLPDVRAYPPVARYTESSLVCEQVLVPEGTTAVELPALSISYFDPRRERYQTLTSQAIQLQVAAPLPPASAAPTSAVASVAAAAPETSDPAPASAAPLAGVGPAVVAAVLVLLVLIVFIVLIIHRAMRRSSHPRQPPPVAPEAAARSVADWLAEAERGLSANDPAAFHTAIFRALQGHLADRHGVPAAAITEEIVTRVLRPAGVDGHRLEAYAALFAICNHSRYAPGATAERPMAETLRRAREALSEN